MRKILVFLMILPLLVILSAPLAFALECPVLMEPAQIAIDQATSAMKQLPKDKQGSVLTLISDAKTLLRSAKQNCEKAGDFDRARAQAQAGAATAYAEAAKDLARTTK